jgi:hypothetical protein
LRFGSAAAEAARRVAVDAGADGFATSGKASMGCFSLGWLEQLLIWLVIIAAIIALIRLILPVALGPLGPVGVTVTQALYIVLWTIVCIAIIILIFDLLGCVVGVPRLR